MIKFFDFALNPVIKESEKLYYRKEGSMVSFCTYFNAIPAGKLKKYSAAEMIIIKAIVENETVLKVKCTGSDDIIACCCTDSYSELIIRISDVPDGSVLMYMTAEGGKLLSASVYLSGTERYISAALITCTYKREEQLISNIRYLLEKSDENDFDIIVSDNGSTLDENLFECCRASVIRNINNGGSGGYHAGMAEAVKRNKYTHFIIMDDDVLIEYCAIQKLLGFLRALKDEYSDLTVCGSMISLYEPCVQFESGGFFSPDGMQTGRCYKNNISSTDGLLADEEEKIINYAAWWLVCMPAGYAENGEYPAPFFIKYDDVEYSLRCKMKIISLCGFGVWHEDFGSKYNAVSAYFDTRNYLFLMKWHGENFNSLRAFRKALWMLTEKICRQQYSFAGAVIMGYRDYLKGEEFLISPDNGSLLTEIAGYNISLYDDSELHKLYNVKYDDELYRICSGVAFSRYMQFLLYGQTIPSVFCRKLSVTDVISDRKEHYFRADRVLHYSVNDRKGYVTKKSIIKTLYLLLKFIYIHIKFSGGRK